MKLPALKPRDLERIIVKAGFMYDYTQGGHKYFEHPLSKLTTCIPQHRRDVRKGLAHKILFTDCQLTDAQVRKLL